MDRSALDELAADRHEQTAAEDADADVRTPIR
jgi:hypothetical protein